MRTLVSVVALCLIVLGLNSQVEAQQETRKDRIERLITGLGADDPEVRDASQEELVKIGAPALRALETATESEDPEVALRARESIEAINGGGARPQPRDQERGGGPQIPQQVPMPDMNELMRESLKQLQGQLPPEFKDLFQLFEQDGTQGQGQGQDEERRGTDRPRVRVWSWSNQPNQGGPSPNTRQGLEGELGIRAGRASAALRSQLGIANANEGLVVNKIVPGGYAEKHLQLHDVLVSIDGRSVRSARDLAPLKEKACTVQFYRRAELNTVELPILVVETREKPAAPRRADPNQEGQKKKERSF